MSDRPQGGWGTPWNIQPEDMAVKGILDQNAQLTRDLADLRSRLERAEAEVAKACELIDGWIYHEPGEEMAARSALWDWRLKHDPSRAAPTPPEPPRDYHLPECAYLNSDRKCDCGRAPTEPLRDPAAAVPLKEPMCGTCGGGGVVSRSKLGFRSNPFEVTRCLDCNGTGVARTPEVTR